MDLCDHLIRCRSKRWYETEAQAIDASRTMTHRFGKAFSHYSCPFCKLFHLTTQKQKVRSDSLHGKEKDESPST